MQDGSPIHFCFDQKYAYLKQLYGIEESIFLLVQNDQLEQIDALIKQRGTTINDIMSIEKKLKRIQANHDKHVENKKSYPHSTTNSKIYKIEAIEKLIALKSSAVRGIFMLKQENILQTLKTCIHSKNLSRQRSPSKKIQPILFSCDA